MNEIPNEQEVVLRIWIDWTLMKILYFGTLVHEVQHLIHWQHDSNEEAWLDEGLGRVGGSRRGT